MAKVFRKLFTPQGQDPTVKIMELRDSSCPKELKYANIIATSLK